ncbi:virulence factor SrfB [Citrobacter freundii]|uniref:virulence factor SrfB n=1 Tax=unclassified Citrobacter TaxID=2644389 RepID=UPI00174C9855|nr:MULTISPECIES: virulence factor SrfB [unclassified Citrobacter]MBY5091168.1 virulence factor SrfB [Citrobacter freundii]MDM2762345.1 virulence factor SrfB [Citrobacter sp. Cpo150]MDM2919334.1 virulence factor SrfB [Citrobacter sp. Cpo032]NTZ33591.1 virulence factor SrfB [Citrobacter freundii]UDV51048.1 virulence factor SrfB [Citrobacter freundii]
MLVNLCDYKQSVTLIANSGVQFLDFGLTPQESAHHGRFVRKTANGPLLRLDFDLTSGRYTLPGSTGAQPEVVKPESTQTLHYSLDVLDGVWLPLPFLRFNPPRTFVEGPDNWARVQVRKLPQPDSAGNTHRVTVALDSQLTENAPAALTPNENDLLNGTRFALAWHDNEIADFLDQTWIDGWLRESFMHHVTQHENRSEQEIQQALRNFEYQAHWLNVLTLLGEQLSVPEVKLVTHTLSTPAIPVDLILDIGNTHTCGVLIEDHGDANDGLRQTAELQVRSLSEPQFLNDPLFTSRLEFSEARFGKQHFSVESGRDDAFIWPSIVRVGDEARKLAMQRMGTEGNSGISSPRRYLWDETPVLHDWRFSQMNGKTQREPLATAFPLMNLMNDDGQPLFSLPQDDRLPVFSPQYSRSTLMTHMLCEILAQALGQINSVATRLRLGFPASPRQLRTLILTLPSAMPKQEREIFRLRMFEAIALVWKAMGWHPQDEDFTTRKQQEKSVVPVPEIQMEWDEASCGQLVWLYNEAISHYDGHTESFFNALARPDRLPEPGETKGRALRVASIDIGGGTTDMAVVHYKLDDGVGANVKITPHLLFREGFKVAGDDMLLDVIQRCVLPALQTRLQQAGVTDAAALLATLFGDSGRIDTQAILRQQTALQLFMPLGHAVLSAWEQSDINDPVAGLHATFGELLSQQPTRNVMNYIQQAIDHALPAGSPAFDVLSVPLQVQFRQLQEALLAGQFTLTSPLHAVCEAISHYRCDILLVTGRPACLPGVQALIRHLQPVPVNRMIWMDNYRVHEWYPFSQQGRIGNPKSTAAVGAMLCSLALDLRLPRFNFKAADIGAYSTVRFLGVLDNTVNTLRDENIWYHDIDLDKPGAKLDARLHFPLRGNVTLGFRQLANSRWPATPLYTLSINSAELAKTIAGDGVLNVRLQLRGGSKESGPEFFILSDAWLQDGTPVAANALTLKLNTLADRRHSGSHYWIDSGSVYLK